MAEELKRICVVLGTICIALAVIVLAVLVYNPEEGVEVNDNAPSPNAGIINDLSKCAVISTIEPEAEMTSLQIAAAQTDPENAGELCIGEVVDVEGEVNNVYPDAVGTITVFLTALPEDIYVHARFEEPWKETLLKINKEAFVSVQGQIVDVDSDGSITLEQAAVISMRAE